MNDLTQCLYDFVRKRRMGEVDIDPEYTEASLGVELQLKKVRQALSEAQQMELQLLLDSISAQNSVECEYLFQVTLKLAHELSRVGAT